VIDTIWADDADAPATVANSAKLKLRMRRMLVSP